MIKSKRVNPFNESKKGDKKFARQVCKTYNTLNRELSIKARCGNCQAADELIVKMTEQNIVLYHLGFCLSDEGRLVKL